VELFLKKQGTFREPVLQNGMQSGHSSTRKEGMCRRNGDVEGIGKKHVENEEG
jgi:hypothetical protein